MLLWHAREFRGWTVPRSRAIYIASDDYRVPYSKGVMAQSLTAAGLPPDRAYSAARNVELQIKRLPGDEMSIDDLHTVVHTVLLEHEGIGAAERFRRWTALKRKDIPIVMLIGGATGSGKSTIATQVAHRLGITRITSTDLVRQVMRAFFSNELMPGLHHSSFDAPLSGTLFPEDTADLGLIGFVEQARQVSVGAQAIVQRAERERMSTLIEGVHLVPGLVQHLDITRCAVVEVVITCPEEEAHRSHFEMRDLQTDGDRPVEHYLQHFDRIRQIQDYLVSQANRRGVPIVEGIFLDTAVQQLTDYTLDVVERVAAGMGQREAERADEAVPEGLLADAADTLAMEQSRLRSA
jgi:2-phosphoglycerate kinase